MFRNKIPKKTKSLNINTKIVETQHDSVFQGSNISQTTYYRLQYKHYRFQYKYYRFQYKYYRLHLNTNTIDFNTNTIDLNTNTIDLNMRENTIDFNMYYHVNIQHLLDINNRI